MGRGKLTPQDHPTDRRRIDELEENFQPKSMRRFKSDPSVKVLHNTELVVVDDGTIRYLAFRLDNELIRVGGVVIEGTENQIITTDLDVITTNVAAPQDIAPISGPTFAELTLTDLTAERLVASDADSTLVSVPDLTVWIAGTPDEITVADDGDGTLTLSLVGGGEVTRYMPFTIWNPRIVQEDDGEVCIWKAVPADLTISRLEVTLDASGNEVVGDLKYADTFIVLANPVVVNAFDTTSGVLDDSSITVGAVPSGKCLYLSFDSAPAIAITQMNVVITFTFD